MFLQVWKRNDDRIHCDCIHGEIIFIPYGMMLTLPATTIHGGGFRSTRPIRDNRTTGVHNKKQQNHGNLRFHLYLANGNTQLSKNQTTNKYTEPNDKTRELADRYVDSPMMKELCESLFV